MHMYKGKNIQRAFRDINNSIADLVNSESNNFLNQTKIFLNTINSNSELNQLLSPYLKLELDIDGIICTRNMNAKINLPLTLDERIAFILQFLTKIANDNKGIDTFLFSIYHHKSLNDNVCDFNNQVMIPILRDLSCKIKDFIEDHITSPTDELTPTQMQIINIGNMDANNSNIILGNNNVQNTTENYLPDKIMSNVSAMLISKGLPIKNLANIETDLLTLIQELAPEKQEPSKLKAVSKKLLIGLGSFTKETLRDCLVAYITNPTAQAAINGLF